MTLGSVPVLITSPLEDRLVQEIADTDPRLNVLHEPDLLPAPAYHADHALPVVDTPEQLARWQALLAEAEVLFDFGPLALAESLATLPNLRWIQATSAGVGQFARRIGLTRSQVIVTTASGVHARPLAEFILMSMLMFVKGAFHLAAEQRAHHWQRYAGEEIAGKVVGIIGVGRIGQEIARTLRGLDARIVGAVRDPGDRRPEDLYLDRLLSMDQLDTMLADLDFLVLCCPHTSQTDGLISAARIAALKPGAVLINVARGAVVDEPAMIVALQSGHLRGAALDVFAHEPLPQDSPLWDMPNVLISPHSASTAASENQKIVDLFRDNLRRYLDGHPLRNVLDKDLLY